MSEYPLSFRTRIDLLLIGLALQFAQDGEFNFLEFGADETMMDFEKLLNESFHLKSFRKGQREIISAVLEKRDVMAVLPTGGGKSLCYQFPAMWSQQLVVVISPLIALMKDQVASLKSLGIGAGCLYAGQPDSEKIEIFNEIRKGGAFLLYLSPERVQKEGFKRWILQQKLALFAIDEAHCVSQWGHDFREEYAQLRVLKELRPDVPTLALTASATPLVLNDIIQNLKLKKPDRMVHGFYRPNLYYQVERCLHDDEKLNILTSALQKTREGRILVYCGTRKITEELASFLSRQHDKVGFYHAGMRTEDRHLIQEKYRQQEIRILVATNAFGMGIDQPDVRLVVHFQLPSNIDSLYQEMGRAGRDGLESTCLLLYSKADKGLQSYFIVNSEAPQAIKNARWRNLEALISYAEGSECRHAEILTYFKDSQRIISCGHCDVCAPDSGRKIDRPVQEVSVVLRKSKSAKAKPKAVAKEVVLDSEQKLRFEALKSWRRQKAQELDLPAFVVFSDRTLKDIAVKNPQSLDELRLVHGIGEQKLEKFGWDLLSELGSR